MKIPLSLQSILTEHVSHNRYSNLTTQAEYSLHLVAESWCSPLGCVRKQISPVSPSGSDRTRGFAFQTTKKKGRMNFPANYTLHAALPQSGQKSSPVRHRKIKKKNGKAINNTVV